MLNFFNRLGNEIKVKIRYYFTIIGLSKIKKNENAITVSNAGKSVLSYMAGEIVKCYCLFGKQSDNIY